MDPVPGNKYGSLSSDALSLKKGRWLHHDRKVTFQGPLKVSPLSYFIMRQSGFHGFQWFLIWPKSGCSWQCWLRWRGRDAVDEVWKILWVYPPWKVKMNFWDPKTKSANKWRPFGLPNHNADRQDSALVGMVLKKKEQYIHIIYEISMLWCYNWPTVCVSWDIHCATSFVSWLRPPGPPRETLESGEDVPVK